MIEDHGAPEAITSRKELKMQYLLDDARILITQIKQCMVDIEHPNTTSIVNRESKAREIEEIAGKLKNVYIKLHNTKNSTEADIDED